MGKVAFIKNIQNGLSTIPNIKIVLDPVKLKFMAINYATIKKLKGIDKIIYLKDKFLFKPEEDIYVSLTKARDTIENALSLDTIKGYALNRFDSQGQPWIKSRQKPFEKWTKQNKEKNNPEIEVYLPDVIVIGLFLAGFNELEEKSEIINKKKINGKFVYEYAPLSDDTSQKTALEHRGGIFLEILQNFSSRFSDETMTLMSNEKAKLDATEKRFLSPENQKLNKATP
jgi:hypothetical protein